MEREVRAIWIRAKGGVLYKGEGEAFSLSLVDAALGSSLSDREDGRIKVPQGKVGPGWWSGSRRCEKDKNVVGWF